MGRGVPDQPVVVGEGRNLLVKQVVVGGETRQEHQTGFPGISRREPVVDISGWGPVDFSLRTHESTY